MKTRSYPLRALYQRIEQRGREDLPLLSVYRELGVVPREGRDDNHNVASEDLSSYKVVKPGDLVLNKMKTWQGSLGVSNYEGIVSPAYFIGRKVGDVEDRFMHHLLRSAPLIAQYGARSKGIRPGQWDLPWDEFAAIRVGIPSFEDQVRIADFLDKETKRIDVLIDKKKELIGLLDTRSRSLFANELQSLQSSGSIQQFPLFAVAREVKNKNSLGLVTDRLSLSHGRIVPKSIESGDGLVPESYDTYNIVGTGDVVLRLTDLQNDQKSLRTGLVETPGIITSAYVTLRTSNLVSGRFLWLVLAGYDNLKRFYELGGGVRQSMKFDELRRLLIPVPSRAQQEQIIEKVMGLRSKSFATSELLEEQIEKLVERRQALITAAVSGQLEI